MGYILGGMEDALRLIISLDRDVFGAVLLSLRVSDTATLFSSLVGAPLGFVIGSSEFWCKNALDIPHLAVKKGAIFGIMGPNGGWKTTLLSIISLLLPPTSGRSALLEKI
jgi:ABC-type polysaccharide/polyol phosphate transport system ATPase subunit